MKQDAETRKPTTRKKKAGSAAKAKTAKKPAPVLRVPGPAPTYGPVQRIPLADIDATDTTCQCRFLGWSHADLLDSLKAHGQREPIHVRGDKPPYTIVDGFRRHGGISELGFDSIDAFMHGAMPDEEARRLAFLLNVARRNLSLLEKINAVYCAEKELGLDREAQAEMFGAGLRTIERWHEVATFPDHIREVVDCKVITVAHGKILRDFSVMDAGKWAKRITKEKLTASTLRTLLIRDRGLKTMGRPRQLFTKKNNKLHVQGKLSLDASRAEKEAFIDELLKLQDAIRETMDEDELDLDGMEDG